MFERSGLDTSISGYGPMASSSKHGYEPSGSIKDGRFLEQLSDHQLLKKNSAPWSKLVT
jgi:hypothetical protein